MKPPVSMAEQPTETPTMAMFASGTPDGEPVHVTLADKRAKVRIDRDKLRILRARTFAAYAAAELHIDDIAAALNFSRSTVKADIAWLAAERAAGRDSLPTDRPFDDGDLD